MSKQTVNIQALYSDLSRFGQNQEYDRALKIANRILNQSSEETEAFQCKVVCLIQMGRFDEVTTLFKKNTKYADLFHFEKAYCEYRLNKTQEALATLKSANSLDYRCKELLAQVKAYCEYRLNKTQEALATLKSANSLDYRCKELLAQVHYRLENYSECYSLYRELIKQSQDDFDEERETNLSAVLASLRLWCGTDMDDSASLSNDGSYELCYNNACLLIGQSRYKDAENALKKSEDLCRSSLEADEDMTEEDVQEELAIIRVQLAYVRQCQGRPEEALQIYNTVLKHRPNDIGLVAVASNNVVTLNKDQNVFDSKKKMKAASTDGLVQKLTINQRESIAMNQCLLHIHANQSDQCQKLAISLKKRYPQSDVLPMIVAAQLFKDKQIAKAVEKLQEVASRNTGVSLNVKLAIAQLHLSQGSVYAACDMLRSLGDLSHKPGVVSTLVTLYLSQEDKASASEVLNAAVEWYKKNQPKSSVLMSLIRSNGDFHLKHGEPQQAARMLQEMRKSKPKDPRLLAQLISAYSQFDPEKAQAISRELTSVGDLGHGVNVDALEMGFSTLGPKYMKKVQKEGGTPTSPAVAAKVIVEKKKARKTKKKGKLPKNLNAEIDPERWLPRRERSYYRGRRKDRRKDIGKGTQGSAAAGDSMEFNASFASKPSPKAAPVSTPTPGPRQQKGSAIQKKKKKKAGGTKW